MAGIPTGTVTFLFTDIEGSTKLAREHPETWETARSRHHAILREAIECHHGYVFQIIGDAFCAAFHTAEEALRAAVKSQVDLHTENWGDVPIKVRMGIHTGKAEVQDNGEYRGYLAMSRVQRLMSAGHGEQVLISAASQELLLEDLPENVSLRDLGERRLKDLIRPEHIYQLIIPGLPVEFPPLKTLDFYRHNLPVQLTSFIGREKEMAEIKQSILTHRLVTLTGVGGTGKTRLALQVAADVLDQFPDGVWFVDLAPITDPGLISQTILSALGIPDRPGLTLLQQLLDFLQKKKLLLLLDNCEHLIDACAKLAELLLNDAPEPRIMTTSREALGVPGEVIWQVPSLSLPSVEHLPAIEQLTQYEAVQLFIERATLVQPHFQVTNASAPGVAQICFRLDGIPLAIELAAARVRTMSLDEIARRLDDRFRLLTGGSRISLERHQTLRAAIDWSYNLLSSGEKILLARLSIFVGGWTLEAAEQVCAGSNDITSDQVLDLLTHLVDKSLVVLDESQYRMLETTRQYASEKLLDSEESKGLRERHLAYFLDLSQKAEQEIHGPNQANWMDRLELDDDNFRGALDWCVSQENTEAALSLLGAWLRTGKHHFSEMQSWFSKVRVLPNVSEYLAPYARLLNFMGRNTWARGDYRSAKTLIEESQALWLKLGVAGELGLAEAKMFLSEIAFYSKTAQSLLEQSFELYQKHENEWGMARSIYGLGHKAIWRGDYLEAKELLLKSLAKFQNLGDYTGVAGTFNSLGELARLQGDYEWAGKCYEESIKIWRKLRHRYNLLIALGNLAWVSLYSGDYHKAKALNNESLKMSNEDGDESSMIYCLLEFAGILGMTGKPEQAALLFGAFEHLFKGVSRPLDPPDQKEFDHYVAVVREHLDEAAFAKAWAEGQGMTLEQAISFALEETRE